MTLKPVDPHNGWGVVRKKPWHFVGLYKTQLEAAALAIDMGAGYEARFGALNARGEFSWSDLRS